VFDVATREIEGITVVDIRGSGRSDCAGLFDAVQNLLRGRTIDVILDIRGVSIPSSAFLGSIMRIISILTRPVPIIVTDEGMKAAFLILPPVGGLPWRLFETEAGALGYVRKNRKGRGLTSAFS
jgi:hypothetical protein